MKQIGFFVLDFENKVNDYKGNLDIVNEFVWKI